MTLVLTAALLLITACLLATLAVAVVAGGLVGSAAKAKMRSFFVDVDRDLEQVLYQPWDRDLPEYSLLEREEESSHHGT